MPLLLMRSFPGTLLDQSCRASVRRQIEYGRERRVPWGISESAYAFTDRAGNYQYRAFGVPGPRAAARALADELVIAPYATALASLGRSGGRGGEPRAAGARGAAGPIRLLRVDRLPAARSRDAMTPPLRRRAAGVVRPRVLRPSPGHVAGRAGQRRVRRRVRQRAFTPIRGCRRPSCCCRSACRARRSSRSRARPKAPTPAPSLPVFASRRFRSPHTTSPHIAVPVERPLHDGADAHRRRLQHLARTRGDAAARRIAPSTPARTTSTCAIRGRATSGRRPISRSAASRRLRDDLRSRQGHLPLPRRRLRDAAAGHGVAGGRRRGAAPVDHQSRRSAARDRSHQLRRDRAGAAGGRLRAPGLRQAVHRDRVRRAERRAPVQPAAARRRRSADVWAFHVLGVEGRLGGAVEWETDRARFLGRGRSLGQPGGARRTRAVRHDRRRARSGGGAARARAAGAGRVRARHLRHRRRARSRRGARAGCASTATAASPRARCRWPSRTCTSRCSTSA